MYCRKHSSNMVRVRHRHTTHAFIRCDYNSILPTYHMSVQHSYGVLLSYHTGADMSAYHRYAHHSF